MQSLKLYYVASPGRAESTRLALTYGGIAFEDFHIPMEEWPTKYKPMSPSGQMPMLEIDGKMYVESLAIFEYACRLAKLVPDCPLKEMACKQFILHIETFFTALRPVFYAPPEEQHAAAKKVMGEITPVIQAIEKLAETKGCDGDVDMADVYALSLTIGSKAGMARYNLPSPFENATYVNKLADRARKNDNIASYLAAKA